MISLSESDTDSVGKDFFMLLEEWQREVFFKYHPIYTKDIPRVIGDVFFAKGDDQQSVQVNG